MSVRVSRVGGNPHAPVEAVELVGLTPGLKIRFVGDDPPGLYVEADGPAGIAAGTDLPALIAALSELAVAYGYDLGAPSPATPHP